MISNQHLLMETPDERLILKLDFESQKITAVSRFSSFLQANLITDQLNEQNLLIYGWNFFATGSLVGDEVVFNPRRAFNGHFFYQTLAGNYLYGFRPLRNQHNIETLGWKYCKFDLITSTEETFNFSSVLDNGHSVMFDNVCFLFL
jgi:hypothetical protein